MSSTTIRTGSGEQLATIPISLIALTLFMGTAAKVVLSPLQELVRTDLAISDHQIGLVQGLALAIPLALLSIPLGRIVDRANRSRLLIGMALACAAGSAMTAFAHDFATMFAARMLVGASVSGAVIAAVSIAADLSNAESRGRTMMLLGLGQVLGSAATFALVGVLLGWLPSLMPAGAAMAPWRMVQLTFAVVMLVAAMLLFLLNEPARHESGNAPNGNLRAVLGQLLTYRRLMLPMLIGMMTIGMADAAASIWAVPVLTRVFHQQPADFGGWMSLVFLLSGIAGTAIGGLLCDFGQKLVGHGGILLGTVIGAALSIPAAFFPVMPTVVTFAALFALLLTAGTVASIASTAAVAVLIPNELRGVTISVFGSIALMMSYGVAPSLVSLAAQAMDVEADLAVPLAMVGVATSVIGTVAFVMAMRVARAEGAALAAA
jgi:predicted MFS family arabinose efflux permease